MVLEPLDQAVEGQPLHRLVRVGGGECAERR